MYVYCTYMYVVELCNYLDKLYLSILRNRFYYQDNCKFLDTTAHYTEHLVVVSCVSNFGIIETQKICIIL